MYTLRPIRPEDDAQVAHIIRSVMTEFGAIGTGFSIEDPEVDTMSAAYADARSLYLVLEDDTKTVVGCGGIAQLAGAEPSICELKKMYFLPEARGIGWGTRLVQQLEAGAAERGYAQMYLETIARMEAANLMYQRLGFQLLDGPMGHTGHSACGLFYAKSLG
jgi:putative acetyltransferase